MLPTIGILLCLYFICKGYQIFQQALLAPEQRWRVPCIVFAGIVWLCMTVTALFFGWAFIESGTAAMPRL